MGNFSQKQEKMNVENFHHFENIKKNESFSNPVYSE